MPSSNWEPSTLAILGQAINELSMGDWRSLIEYLGQEAWAKDPSRRRLQDAFDSALDALPVDGATRRALEDQAGEVERAAVAYGALLGYILGQTWPKTIQDLDGWLALAVRWIEGGKVPEYAQTT